MESLKKLQKKYGKKKLNQFFKDIDKFLTVPQKKLNKKYIRLTEFGFAMNPNDPAYWARVTKDAKQKNREAQQKHRNEGLVARIHYLISIATEKPVVVFENNGETDYKVVDPDNQVRLLYDPDYARGLSEEVTRGGGRLALQPQLLVDETRAGEKLTNWAVRPENVSSAPEVNSGEIPLKFVGEMYFFFRELACSALEVGNLYGFGKLCIHFSDILQLVGESDWFLGGALREGLNTHFGTQGVPQQITPQKMLKLLTGGKKVPTHDLSAKEFYKYYSTGGKAATRGWENTISQNLLSHDPQAKYRCRCALCGCFMFYADAEKDNKFLCYSATVELEHQIAGSTALKLYLDLYRHGMTRFGDRTSTYFTGYTEKVFFEGIGGEHAVRENRFVYCCTLCNQIKSDMYPFETKKGMITASTNKLNKFEAALEREFDRIIGARAAKEVVFKEGWRNIGLKNQNKCSFVWVLQTIFTFLSDIENEDGRLVLPENRKNHEEGRYLTLAWANNRIQIANRIYLDAHQKTIFQNGVWNEIKKRKTQPDFCYFGRPVYDKSRRDMMGKTKGPGVVPFKTLAEKYNSIIEDIKMDFGFYGAASADLRFGKKTSRITLKKKGRKSNKTL